MSIVRDNLMTRDGYSPYCGGENCLVMPRTAWNGSQFQCPHCEWKTTFDNKFLNKYKKKWGIK